MLDSRADRYWLVAAFLVSFLPTVVFLEFTVLHVFQPPPNYPGSQFGMTTGFGRYVIRLALYQSVAPFGVFVVAPAVIRSQWVEDAAVGIPTFASGFMVSELVLAAMTWQSLSGAHYFNVGMYVYPLTAVIVVIVGGYHYSVVLIRGAGASESGSVFRR